MSEPINLLITIPLEKALLAALKKRFPQLKITHHPIQKGEQTPEELWAQAELLYTFRALPTREQAPRLRWVQFHSAGIDAFAGHALLQPPTPEQHSIVFTTLSGANAPQVAEHALALILALGHNLPALLADQSRAKWSVRRLERFIPRELRRKTVGILGYGSVGRQLAKLLQPFSATILASKRDLLNEIETDQFRPDGPPPVDAEGQPLPELSLVRRLYPGRAVRSMFKDCDIVVITAPLTDETRGMIGAKQLEALQPHAILVDVSRGGILDHEALIAALKAGSFAGAALDVFPEEPLPADSPLWEMPNVIISPHIAGLSPRYDARAMTLFTENLALHLAGQDLLNEYEFDRGY